MDHNLTPRMTRHALARCQEMGIPTKVAKAIWRTATTTYPSNSQDGRPGVIASSELFPGYAIVVAEGYDGHPTVVTVVFRTTDTYDRNGGTYTARKDQD
jgi:hypothetical protein